MNIWESIYNYFDANSWNMLRFLLIAIFGFFMCKILIKILKAIFSKTRLEKITQKFILSALRIAIWVVYIMTLLNILGIDLTGIIAAFAAGAVAVGLALENSLSNLASGIILVSSNIIKEGDYIELLGVEGTVETIGLLETTIITVDNKIIHIPNSKISSNSLTNYSSKSTRRIDLIFCVEYSSNVETVREIILNVLHSNGKILLDPKPNCRLSKLNDNSIDFFTTCWCDNEDYWEIYYYIIDLVFDEFKKHNIKIPFNQLEVRLKNEREIMPTYQKALPTRVEKIRDEEMEEGDFIDKFINKQKNRNFKRKHKNKRNNENNLPI